MERPRAIAPDDLGLCQIPEGAQDLDSLPEAVRQHPPEVAEISSGCIRERIASQAGQRDGVDLLGMESEQSPYNEEEISGREEDRFIGAFWAGDLSGCAPVAAVRLIERH